MFALARHRRARLDLGPDAGRVRRVRGRCWPRSSASSAAPPRRWSRRTPGRSSTLVSGTTVMLGVTGLLVGTVFLTSIFFQTVLGYSALQRRSRVPAVRARITAGTHVASHAAGHDVAAHDRRRWPRPRHRRRGPAAPAGAAAASYATDLLPGLLVLGFGVGMVFVAVSVTAMAGIPPSTPAWRPAS